MPLSEHDWSLIIILIYMSDFPSYLTEKLITFGKSLTKLSSGMTVVTMISLATTDSSHTLCLFVMLISCYKITRRPPQWIFVLLLVLSNDIHLNPGPDYHSNFFTFMSWNLNSLTKDDFKRVELLEANSTIFNYDIIALCETSLTNDTTPNVPEIEGYTFVSANNADNSPHGGVGIFYKNSLPLTVRHDLSFNESLVVELKFQRKKVFFTVLYRSPSSKHNSVEFQTFLDNFNNLYSNICTENPYAIFFTGDFNGHSVTWWPDGDTNPEGKAIDDTFNSLNLAQVISEPTNFTPNSKPSCIDLIVTDQPHLVLDSGTRPSLDPNLSSPNHTLQNKLQNPLPQHLREETGIITGLMWKLFRKVYAISHGNNIFYSTTT